MFWDDHGEMVCSAPCHCQNQNHIIMHDIFLKERKFLLAVERGDVASTRY